MAGQGGTLALSTYLLKSGSLQGAQGGQTGRVGPFGPAHPEQGQLDPHLPQRGPCIPRPDTDPVIWKPSVSLATAGVDCLPTKNPTITAARRVTAI